MDNDLNEKLEQFLSRPDSMDKIQSMLAAFGGESKPDTPPSAESSSAPLSGGLPDLSMLQTLMPLMQGLGNDDKDPNVALLRALKPYLHDGREKRIDEAIEMMRLAKLLPLLNIKL